MEETHKMPGEYEFDGIIFNAAYKPEVLKKIKEDFKFKDDDIVLITYPKSGTTWMQVIMQNIAFFGKEDNDKDIFMKIPYLEMSFPAMDKDMYDIVQTMPSPRMIKSHLPYTFLENALSGTKAKVIVVMRNPKDTIVSYYHFYRNNKDFGCFPGSFDDFFKQFMNGSVCYGDWFDFTKGYLKQKDQPNFCIIKYEDIKTNPRKSVNEVADFIGRRITMEQVEDIVKATSFEEMKPNVEAVVTELDFMKKGSLFMRKGIVGDWKSHFTVQQNELFDKKYQEKMNGYEHEFIFE